MRIFSKITLIALVLIIAIGAVGCQPKAKSGPVTIHVLTMDQAGLKPAEIDQIAREFEAKNPDIKVSWNTWATTTSTTRSSPAWLPTRPPTMPP